MVPSRRPPISLILFRHRSPILPNLSKPYLSLFSWTFSSGFETNLQGSKILFSPSGSLCLQFAERDTLDICHKHHNYCVIFFSKVSSFPTWTRKYCFTHSVKFSTQLLFSPSGFLCLQFAQGKGGCSRCLLDHHRSFFLNTNWNKWDRLPFCISCIFFILIYFPSPS